MPPQEFLGPRPGRLPLLRVEGSSRGSVRVESLTPGWVDKSHGAGREWLVAGVRDPNRRPEVGRGVVGGARVLFDGPDDEARTLCGQGVQPQTTTEVQQVRFALIDQEPGPARGDGRVTGLLESLVGEPQTVGCRSQGGPGPSPQQGLFDADAPFLVGESGTAGPGSGQFGRRRSVVQIRRGPPSAGRDGRGHPTRLGADRLALGLTEC